MSMPRQVLPGATYLVTKSCNEQRMFLVPSAWLNRIFCYCVALAARRTGVKIHALCVLSNHWHIVLTDPHARLPEFMRLVHQFVARCLNLKHHRTGSVFSTSHRYNAVTLGDAGDVHRKLVYVATNPCTAGLTATAKAWPGFHTAGMAFGETRTVERPPELFRDDSSLPEELPLRLYKPPQFGHWTNAQATAELAAAVADREHELQADLKARGRTFRGARRCRKVAFGSRPKHRHPPGAVAPHVAAEDKELLKALLERRRAFLAAYRDAYLRWRAGKRNVVFPPGTYALRVYAGVRVADDWDP